MHNQEEDLWTVVSGKVYDLTKFFRTHPGGPDIIVEYAGKDATERFEQAQHTKTDIAQLESYLIGEYVAPRIFTKLDEIMDHN